MGAIVESLKCKRCGAPLTVDPESLIKVCDYCGYPNIIGGDFQSEHVYVVPTQPRNAIENKFMEIVRSDPQLSKISSVEVLEISGVYFPAWYTTLKATVTAAWHTTRWEQRGNRMVAREVYLHETREVSRNVFLPARRRVPSEPFKDALASYTVKKSDKISPLQEDFEWEKIKLDFLGVEIGRQEASSVLVDKFIDSLREEYRSRGQGIDYFSARVDSIGGLTLLYVPVWTITYAVEDSTYTMVLDGYDGTCVYRSEPITAAERLLRFSTGLLLSAISGPLFAATASLTSLEASVVFLGLLSLAAYSVTNSAIASARVEKL
ncbi:MAG: hypothetical protein ABWK01_07830 [Infirmifilum sp.]